MYQRFLSVNTYACSAQEILDIYANWTAGSIRKRQKENVTCEIRYKKY